MRNTLIAGAAALLVGTASVVSAQTIPTVPSVSIPVISIPNVGSFGQFDQIVQKDFDMFSKLNVGARFGIQFHTHKAVCTDAGSDTAHCDARVTTDTNGTPLATPKLITGYTPAQLLKAYNLSGQASATRPTVIAIVDAYDDPNIQNDLNTYSAAFGIPSLPTCSGTIANSNVPCFKKVSQSGSTFYPQRNSGWGLEIALDVETAHAICQNCSILLVEANSSSFNSLMAAEDRAVTLGAKVVSNSFGAPEFSGETSYDYHFNHPGVAFTVSAGDSGYGVEYPAASRYVTAVGGTSLFLNSDGSYNSEAAWSGTGSGCSAFEAKQPWQLDGCAKRTVADVSADADPNTGAAVYDSYAYFGQSGWFQVGGTSLSSPIIAAVYALSGNIPAATTESSLPYATPSALHDVLSGSNGSCGGSYLCLSMTGFDGPTGLGSPNSASAF